MSYPVAACRGKMFGGSLLPDIWYDTFTDTDAVALASHTPEVGSGGYTATQDAPAIYSNRWTQTTAAGETVLFEANPNGTVTINGYIGTTSGTTRMDFYFRFISGTDYWRIRVDTAGGVSQTHSLTEITGGVSNVRATDGNPNVPLQGETYTWVVVINGNSVQSTIGNSTINYGSATAHQSESTAGLALVMTGTPVTYSYYDDLSWSSI